MPQTAQETNIDRGLDQSGREWVCEAINKIEADFNRSSDTHLIKLDLPCLQNIDLYLKDESTHPSGSLKHRLARSLILYGLCNGWIRKGTPIIESSSGSTAISEAYFARLLGLPFIAVVPDTTAKKKIAQIEFYGGECHRVPPQQIYDEAARLAAQLGGHYVDQFTFAERATDWRGNNNIADSIFTQMGRERFAVPAWVVVSAGTGGTSSTIGRYIRYQSRLFSDTRLCVVDPENSVFFDYFRSGDAGLTVGRGSRIEGIGRPRVEPSFLPDVIDRMIRIPDAASIATIRWLESILGRKCGGSTGTNLFGSLQIAAEMMRAGTSGSLVTMICDPGETTWIPTMMTGGCRIRDWTFSPTSSSWRVSPPQDSWTRSPDRQSAAGAKGLTSPSRHDHFRSMSESETKPVSDSERLDWLRLIRSENVGPVVCRQLLERYGTPAAALEALPELAGRAGGRRRVRVCSLDAAAAEAEAARKAGVRLLALPEPAYPALLRALDDAPPVLAVLGDAEILSRRAIGIVGARNASANGRRFAETLAADLAAAGLCVVSGLARGIDTAAHRGALPAPTVAVVAGGVDVIYPPENEALHAEIAEQGAVISEVPLGTVPQSRHFPRRNRLISGLSLGTVVVEAAKRSGSLTTARCAGEQGREVFAVPGSPLDPRAAGCNRLIREGANLIETAADVLDGLGSLGLADAESPPRPGPERVAEPPPEPGNHERASIEELLGADPVPVDDLVRLSALPAAVVSGVLLELELAGRVERHPGNRFARLYKAPANPL